MIAADRSFPNGSPVCDYWLSRCEGFTVRAGHRTLGIVETVEHEPGVGRADSVVVRRPRRRARSIPTDDVLAVVPARKVLLARRHHHAAPAVRRAYAATTPVVTSAAVSVAIALRALATWTAATLRREVPHLTRLLLAEIHDRNENHGDEPSVARAHRHPNKYDYGLSTRGR